jgi:hypothetical protein
MPISIARYTGFSSMARHLAAALLAPALMLWLAGCSSTEPPRADGGIGGTTGSGGADGGDACAALNAAYAQAYQEALACDPTLDSPQCTQLASPSLPCGGNCGLYAHDTTVLDQLRQQYYAVCPPVACPAIACVKTGTSTCVPVDGGTTGVCTRVLKS